QVMVLTRGGEEKSPYQDIVTVAVVDGKWRITEISCAQGEIAPERAYDFEHEGFLLKSVPPPLDPQYWHLVYEENGQLGHTVPLFFSAESICIDGAGNESICVPTQFTDASPAFLQAAMTEAGAAVRRLQLK
ncbi:hypothetical protein GW766_02120, partial [Candidatus Parcubacteria bacterium]|nr:hypothetical protein [Candidatus Parcubacteria bacterium]